MTAYVGIPGSVAGGTGWVRVGVCLEVGERRTLLGASPRGVSQTLVQYARVRAVAAADVAAPVEGAVAALGDALCARAVAPATAEQLAAVQRGRRAVAGAPRGARCPQASAVCAEIGRFLKVDEVVGGGRLVSGVFGLQAQQFRPRGAVAAAVAVEDARGAIESVAQHVAHGAQRGQPHPARAHRARARHPVALALLAHLGEHGLGGRGKKGCPRRHSQSHHPRYRPLPDRARTSAKAEGRKGKGGAKCRAEIRTPGPPLLHAGQWCGLQASFFELLQRRGGRQYIPRAV